MWCNTGSCGEACVPFFKCCFPTRSALCGWGEVGLHLDSGITEEAGVKANAGFEVKCQRDCD